MFITVCRSPIQFNIRLYTNRICRQLEIDENTDTLGHTYLKLLFRWKRKKLYLPLEPMIELFCLDFHQSSLQKKVGGWQETKISQANGEPFRNSEFSVNDGLSSKVVLLPKRLEINALSEVIRHKKVRCWSWIQQRKALCLPLVRRNVSHYIWSVALNSCWKLSCSVLWTFWR